MAWPLLYWRPVKAIECECVRRHLSSIRLFMGCLRAIGSHRRPLRCRRIFRVNHTPTS